MRQEGGRPAGASLCLLGLTPHGAFGLKLSSERPLVARKGSFRVVSTAFESLFHRLFTCF